MRPVLNQIHGRSNPAQQATGSSARMSLMSEGFSEALDMSVIRVLEGAI
jgi:hypothetical protein